MRATFRRAVLEATTRLPLVLAVVAAIAFIAMGAPRYISPTRLAANGVGLREMAQRWQVLAPLLFVAADAALLIVLVVPAWFCTIVGGLLFDRALKLYLAAWLDFDLVTAGEMVALAALEHSLRDCYLGNFRERHTKKIVARAKSEKRSPKLKENFRPESIRLDALLKHMHQRDGLMDDQLPCVCKYGGSVVRLLTGEADPSLADMRNVRMHGNPFGSGHRSGLLELVRDLIEYAYRERIASWNVGAPTELHLHA